MLGILLERYPVKRMKMKTTPPSGNCRSIESRVDQLLYSRSAYRRSVKLYAETHPNVDTMSGPNPLTAPLTVYAAAIISATSQILISPAASRICEPFNF